jgi:hypothetical protein
MLPTLVHRYTQTTRIEGEDNAHGQATWTPGKSMVKRCLYEEQEILSTTEAGQVMVNVPVLMIDSADPLQEGEVITEIKDREGRVLAKGPLTVGDIKPLASMGAVWRKQAQLTGAETA